MGEVQKTEEGMFLQISKIRKNISIIIYGQLFSNLLKWKCPGVPLDSTGFEDIKCLIGLGSHLVCKYGVAQNADLLL